LGKGVGGLTGTIPRLDFVGVHQVNLARVPGGSAIGNVQASGGLSLPLPRETLLKRFHVQRPDGEMVSGARAFIEVWAALPGWRWLARLCRTPGVPSLLEASYRIFLKLRPTLQKLQRRKSST
ncbi:MAG: thiol-disulfide oxidoreductase DCC family protein, partial [Betaproteobacteria bacterium]